MEDVELRVELLRDLELDLLEVFVVSRVLVLVVSLLDFLVDLRDEIALVGARVDVVFVVALVGTKVDFLVLVFLVVIFEVLVGTREVDFLVLVFLVVVDDLLFLVVVVLTLEEVFVP